MFITGDRLKSKAKKKKTNKSTRFNIVYENLVRKSLVKLNAEGWITSEAVTGGRFQGFEINF